MRPRKQNGCIDVSEIALRTPAMLQLGASKRFPSMLKNTPRAHQKCKAFLSVLRNHRFLTLARRFLTEGECAGE